MAEQQPATDNVRKQRLAQAIQTEVVSGARVETQGDFSAILRAGVSRNHVLHIILSILTAGVWLLVYIPLLFINRPRVITLNVDDWANVLRQQV